MARNAIKADGTAPLTRISYWLTVVGQEKEYFSELIESLAALFGGPTFAPHLTIYSGPAGKNDPARLLAEAIGQGGELRLPCTGLDFSENFTKACYLTFESATPLESLSEKLRQNSRPSERYHLKPHLSLFYGKLTRENRQRIKGMVELPEIVRFGGLAAVATTAATKSSRDVLRWQLLASRELTALPES
ncbi:MAG: hypothetical protein R6W72_10275 [Desulfurivibrionaceae bacterium]